MPAPRVLIIGGGIAGPALALWLARLKYDVTVVERSDSLRQDGQQIDLRGQGVRAMQKMGIEAEVRSKVAKEEGLQFIKANGKPVAAFPANRSGEGMQGFTSEFEIMRGELGRILYDATKDTTRYIFGTTVDKLQEDGDGVEVTLSSGQRERYDLVVGADGQSSRTRRVLMGQPDNSAPDPVRSLGLYVCYFNVPSETSDSSFGSVCHFPESRLVATRGVDNDQVQVLLAIHAVSKHARPVAAAIKSRAGDAESKRAWAEAFADAGWEVPRFADAMLHSKPAESFYQQEIVQVRADAWSRGRVVLLGDAGYCPSPITGLGTSLALCGAYVLAGELAQHTRGDTVDVHAALAGYERELRPLVRKAQRIPPGIPRLVYPKSTWGIVVLQAILGLAAWLRIDKLLQWFGSDDVGGWKFPDYPELGVTQ